MRRLERKPLGLISAALLAAAFLSSCAEPPRPSLSSLLAPSRPMGAAPNLGPLLQGTRLDLAALPGYDGRFRISGNPVRIPEPLIRSTLAASLADVGLHVEERPLTYLVRADRLTRGAVIQPIILGGTRAASDGFVLNVVLMCAIYRPDSIQPVGQLSATSQVSSALTAYGTAWIDKPDLPLSALRQAAQQMVRMPEFQRLLSEATKPAPASTPPPGTAAGIRASSSP